AIRLGSGFSDSVTPRISLLCVRPVVYESLSLTDSPPLLVLKACQIRMLIPFLMNRTWPSHMAALTPPGWRLRAPIRLGWASVELPTQGGLLNFGYSQIPPSTTSGSLLLGLI